MHNCTCKTCWSVSLHEDAKRRAELCVYNYAITYLPLPCSLSFLETMPYRGKKGGRMRVPHARVPT
jgi:hypothetical protein